MTRSVLYRDKVIWPKLYCTYVRPHLEYASSSWNPWLEQDIKVLEKVQMRALRQIPALNHLSYEDKLARLGMTTLRQRRERADLCQVWKIIHKHDDVPESTWFTRANTNSLRTTRQNASDYNLSEPRVQKEIKRNFFSTRVTKPWNNLPEHVKSANTISAFKSKYDDLMQSIG